MAKFVLAGKTDCPHYAKAELLADCLQQTLPDFSVHKVSIVPHEWKEWLETICQRNGWKHEQSPLVWRELVAQGGKGTLIGGFSDFLEHCQGYYSVTSDMPTEMMLSVAAENLQTKMSLDAEEQHRLSLIKPVHIWITCALSPTCHFLIPNLLSAEVFPHISAISLHLLDLEASEEELQGVTIHTDLEQAFQGADVILLLDECCSDDGETEDEEEKKKKQVKRISDRYRTYGQLIDTRANKEVKVMVSGDSFVNLRCSLLLDHARSIDSYRFISMATQLENEARAIVAKKLKVKTSDVTNVIVWGNISGSFYADLQKAKVFNYDGAIKGPAFFSQPVRKILHDRKWLETDFQDLVCRQRAAVASKSCQAAGMSVANGILTVLKAWNGICGPHEVFSMGVLCPGFHDLPEGIVLSVPVSFVDGKWSVRFDVPVEDELKERLKISASELKQEKELGSEI
ncbi:putative malate dehydrogenase 1B [Collichthys lucidus]|uniref:Putative malate dehydrogenase 1B n=1 Tax=Collichthys lucidus TaxID=240159 RepID=A0A4U5TYE5_COLLU|nr:putative malate dehydrogenase 1B [Collichthys lucidus]